jgi:hypothetical protein
MSISLGLWGALGGGTNNCIDTSHLLPDHEHDGDESTLAVCGDEPHLLEQRLGGGIANEISLILELQRHVTDFVADILVVRRKPILRLVWAKGE